MNKPHKYAALIKTWADGAIIQWHNPDTRFTGSEKVWTDCHNNLPTWNPLMEYRVKPEPKPDSVKIRKLTYNADIDCICVQGPGKDQVNGNIMFFFDGETGVLKDVQLLAKE